MYVRVTAQATDGPDSAPNYLIQARNNVTTAYAQVPHAARLYSVRGTAFNSGSNSVHVDLDAASGWIGSGYGTARTTAPFEILDQLVMAARRYAPPSRA